LKNGDDSLFNRANGQVNGNIDMGVGTDTFWMLGGNVSGTVDVGAGNDFVAMVGGTLSSNLLTGDGADSLFWSGGNIVGGLNMGANDDSALFFGLTRKNLVRGLRIDGGDGNDALTWNHTVGGDVSRYVNWEAINLTHNSQMTFSRSSTLTLGDAGTGTGTLS